MFIDTNVLVKARIPGAPDHVVARAVLERAFRDPEPLRISRQVIREYPGGGHATADLAGGHHPRGSP